MLDKLETYQDAQYVPVAITTNSLPNKSVLKAVLQKGSMNRLPLCVACVQQTASLAITQRLTALAAT